MSVLVKGMEKPEHCGYCRFRYDGICHALQKTQYRMDECPLVGIDDVPDICVGDTIRNTIEELEAERKKGRWILKPNIYGVAYCSECDYELHTDNTNYCPNCGADMRERKDD